MKLPKSLRQVYRTESRPRPDSEHPPRDHLYRPHTEYDGKVVFSVCLFTGGAPPPPNWGGAPQLGGPQGYPPTRGAPLGVPPNWGGAPGGTPPPNKFGQKFGTKNGQRFGQKTDNVLDKKRTTFWTKNWTNILETFGQTLWKLLEVGGARAERLLRSRRRTVLFGNNVW